MEYFIANWKMNMTIKEILLWLEVYSKNVSAKAKEKKIIICPATVHIPLLRECNNDFGFQIGSQDISVFSKGAHTGETGAFQINEFCQYSLIGHSERNEPVETVLKKRDIAFEGGVTPIVCFVSPEDIEVFEEKGAILAWEDPSNISVNGVYREKKSENIAEGIKKIKSLAQPDTPIIYGGSVNRDNIKILNDLKEINGVLIGNASLDPKHFADIINSCI